MYVYVADYSYPILKPRCLSLFNYFLFPDFLQFIAFILWNLSFNFLDF